MTEADRIGLMTPIKRDLQVPGVVVRDAKLRRFTEGDRVKLRKSSQPMGHMREPFNIDYIDMFEPFSETAFFNSHSRQQLVFSIIETPPGDGGAGIDVSMLLAGQYNWRVPMSAAESQWMDEDEVSRFHARCWQVILRQMA